MPSPSQNLAAALATITESEIRAAEVYFRKLEKSRCIAGRLQHHARQYPVIAGLVDPENLRKVAVLPVGDDARAGVNFVGFVLSVLSDHRAYHGSTSLQSALWAIPAAAVSSVLASFNDSMPQAEIDSLFDFAAENFPAFTLTLIDGLKTQYQSGKVSDSFYGSATAAALAVISAARDGN